jgi:uncharacterized peroxidase-related enzyme
MITEENIGKCRILGLTNALVHIGRRKNMQESSKPRLNPVDIQEIDGALKKELERTNRIIGTVPNVFLTTANSLPALMALNRLFETAKKCTHRPKVAEQIALALSTVNGCLYCARAHTASATRAGLKPEEVSAARRGIGTDNISQAAIDLALELNNTYGNISDDFLAKTRQSGITDKQIMEVILITIQNLFTHLVNNLAHTHCEYPEIEAV